MRDVVTTNTFEIKTANIMVTYDNILRQQDIYILEKILNDYRDKFDEYLNLDPISTLSPKALLPLVINRPKKNILEWLATKDFDYEKNYKNLHDRFKGMYQNSPELRMYNVVKAFAKSYCIKKVYIWSEEYDKRIHFDLTDNELLENPKVEYAVGDIQSVLDKTHANIFYDWDLDRVLNLLEKNSNLDTFFAIATYGFNINKEDNSLRDQVSDEYDNLVPFCPFTFDCESLFFG